MARNDIQTFEIFKKIYENYKNEKNPFAKYKDEFGPIKKYSKDGKGPEIYQVKYISDKLGNHLDISHKYNVEMVIKRLFYFKIHHIERMCINLKKLDFITLLQ